MPPYMPPMMPPAATAAAFGGAPPASIAMPMPPMPGFPRQRYFCIGGHLYCKRTAKKELFVCKSVQVSVNLRDTNAPSEKPGRKGKERSIGVAQISVNLYTCCMLAIIRLCVYNKRRNKEMQNV